MQKQKFYTMSEAAKLIGVSRQSIYKKIDRPDLQEYLSDNNKGKAISEKGLNVLRKLFEEYLDSKPEDDNLQSGNGHATVNSQSTIVQDSKYMDFLIDSLRAENEYLKLTISDQSKQISSQSNQIDNLTRLLENSQILLKKEQERNQLLLEAAQAPKYSFFSRLFKTNHT